MLSWLSSLRRTAPRPAASAAAPPPGPTRHRAPDPEAAAPPPQPASALSWLLHGPSPREDLPTPAERLLLQALDRQLDAPTLSSDLLPRAPGVIPQLIALLRQEEPSRAAMVQQVLKDMMLTAEVLRLARSPYYGAMPVETLEAALDRIGSIGLQSAMARVLIRPVYHAQAGTLMARAAPRLWLHAEHKSMLCAEIAAGDGSDRFEGFLAGLMHDTGWLALLRLLDRQQLAPSLPSSLAFDAALDARKDRLFGRLTAKWDLTPALTSLSEHLHRGPSPTPPPLARALYIADRRCTAELSGHAPAA
jgi:hypothetical protein